MSGKPKKFVFLFLVVAILLSSFFYAYFNNLYGVQYKTQRCIFRLQTILFLLKEDRVYSPSGFEEGVNYEERKSTTNVDYNITVQQGKLMVSDDLSNPKYFTYYKCDRSTCGSTARYKINTNELLVNLNFGENDSFATLSTPDSIRYSVQFGHSEITSDLNIFAGNTYITANLTKNKFSNLEYTSWNGVGEFTFGIDSIPAEKFSLESISGAVYIDVPKEVGIKVEYFTEGSNSWLNDIEMQDSGTYRSENYNTAKTIINIDFKTSNGHIIVRNTDLDYKPFKNIDKHNNWQI